MNLIIEQAKQIELSQLPYLLSEFTQAFKHQRQLRTNWHDQWGFDELAPDWTTDETLYDREELTNLYKDWETLICEEFIFPCNSSGISHQHAAQILVLRKPV